MPMAGENFPFNLESFKEEPVKTVGSQVLMPEANNSAGVVVKVSKKEYPKTDENLIGKIAEERKKMELVHSIASEESRKTMPPQQHMIMEGENPDNVRSARIQQYFEGKPLNKIGFYGLMNLEQKHLIALRSLVADSIKCYLKHGVNFDLFGSDERDAIKNSRALNIKRIIFPLRNSSNILLTEDGIKFIDADTIGAPGDKLKLTAKLFQALLFVSSVVNYLILSTKIVSNKKPSV